MGDKEKAKKVYENYIPLYGDDVADTVIFCASRNENVKIFLIKGSNCRNNNFSYKPSECKINIIN
jgi:NADP-dependent 3-hydroxy acid dehydrogenase YdfG